MTSFIEGNLKMTIPDDVQAWRFDGDNHGLGHCMKAVDFIVALPDRTYFIEIKDPHDPRSQEKDRNRWISKFASGALDGELKYKFRDSFLYEWASGRIGNGQRIYYLVLVAIEDLAEPAWLSRQDELRRILPLLGPDSVPWSRPFVHECLVFNVTTWNRHFPGFLIERSPA